MAVGGVDLAARGDEAQRGGVELDADFDAVGLANGIDPCGFADLTADAVGERAIQQAEEGALFLGRQITRREDLQRRQCEIVLREIDEAAGSAANSLVFVKFDDGCDVARGGFGEMAGDLIPMAFKEDESEYAFQQYNGHENDEQCAGIQAFRQQIIGEMCLGAIMLTAIRAQAPANRRCGANIRSLLLEPLHNWPCVSGSTATITGSLSRCRGCSLYRARSGDRRDWMGRFQSCAEPVDLNIDGAFAAGRLVG